MRKNLVISCSGPNSLHKHWLGENRNFDIFIINYTDKKDLYKNDGEYYCEKKGTKFNIIYDLNILDHYEYIFVPDDDIMMSCDQINKLFEFANKYDLWLCQPSIVGYHSVDETLYQKNFILRYTNWVEIMCPCFSKYAWNICKSTFIYSKSCWGIEKLWDKKLDFPIDKIAIIDEITANHTRPCFTGDNYSNNKIEKPELDLHKVVEENNLDWQIKQYKKIPKIKLKNY